MAPEQLLAAYKTAYKQASISDAMLGGMIANSINGGKGERPQYSDADVVAHESDPIKREALIKAMADNANVNDGHFSRTTGSVVGGLAGMELGGLLGELAQRAAWNDEQKASGKYPLAGSILGSVGGAALGGYLGNNMVRSAQQRRRARYEAALRQKVKVLRGE